MTEQEIEVLKEIKKIEKVLEIFKDGGDLIVNIATQQQLNVILGKLKEAYPTVKYPLRIDSCAGCIRNFLGDLLPVFARLSKQEKTEVNEVNPFNPIGSDTEIKVEEVPEQENKTTTRRKGKK
ncbi:hypothetical protein [Sphingobacterium multivorum]|uniref:hypothetical protein n=1 Tax=Sphingobacterium multivorum TaxID=28454 RepID=UPI0028A907C9|nr:hypothetical protein [Sphingobacterium multivorum]